MRDLIRQQQETDRTIKAWVDALGERPEGSAGRVLIETLQSMVLATMAALKGRGKPASLEELGRLSLILKRIESTDKLRKDSARAAEKEKAEKAAAGRPKGKGGLSPEAVAIIRAEVEGRAPPWPPRTVIRAEAEGNAPPPSPPPPRTVIRAEVEGDPPPPPRPPRTVTSVPVDPWDPAESRLSQLIPADPGESRPKNVSAASQHIAHPAWLCPPPL